eukprot:6291846-Lingulodinium_polyedra.AAC.1
MATRTTLMMVIVMRLGRRGSPRVRRPNFRGANVQGGPCKGPASGAAAKRRRSNSGFVPVALGRGSV